MTHDVFVCHSSEDRTVANAICSTLEQHRIRCWIAPRDVLPGSDYAVSILEAIAASKLLVLVFSGNSNQSAHVHREVERAVSHGIPILPFRLADVTPSPSLEYFISNSHWLDAVTPPLEQHLQHLVGTVQLLLQREGAEHAPLPGGATMPPPVFAPPTPVPVVRPGAPPPPGVKRSKRWPLLAALGAVIVLVVGLIIVTRGDEKATSTTDEPVETDEPVDTAAPISTTEPPVTAMPTVPPADLLQGPVDVLGRFTFTEQMTFSWEGATMTVDVTGSYVAPSDQYCTLSFEMSGVSGSTSATVIGDRAWITDPNGITTETTPDDPDVTSILGGCPTSHEMWGEDFETAPPGGVDVVENGMALVSFDVTELAGSWGQFFGLPTGVTAEQMVIFVSPDRTWVAGMDASLVGAAEVFNAFMGIPPAGVTGDCTLTFSLRILQPDDPSVVILPPV